MIKRLRGVLFVLLLFFSTLLGAVFILTPFIPLILISPRFWRFCADRFVGYWLTFPASLCGLMFGTKFYVSGDLIDHQEPGLIIMNHRTRLDWLFFWNGLYKMDPWLLTSEKILLKASLKFLPGAGWAMECASYLFLQRKFEADMCLMNDMLSYYKRYGKPYQLLLFPEGTDRGEHAAKLSDAFAERYNLPYYHYVLHPRTKGFTFLVQNMRKKNYIKYVYDVTVGYPKEMVCGEADIIKFGYFPSEVHFDIKRYHVDELPSDSEEGLSNWLCTIWKRKEARLAQFYEKDKKFLPSCEQFIWPVETAGIGYYCAFMFWTLSTTFWAYITYRYMAVKFFFCFSCLFYVCCQKFFGGVDLLALSVAKKCFFRKGS